MSKGSDKSRLEFIFEMIEDIEYIIQKDGVTNSLKNRIHKPALLMSLMQIGETLNKIESVVLKKELPIKGAYSIRNFIAHDYEGVDLALVEHIIRNMIPKLKTTIEENLL